MKWINRRTYQNSFWLTFFFTLLINQFLLFLIFYFVLIKPVANDLSDLFGVTLEATKLIKQHDTTNGINQLKINTTPYSSIDISNQKNNNLEPIPWYFFGIRLISESLKNINEDKIEVGFILKSNKKLVFQSIEEPIVSIAVPLENGVAAKKYLEYSIILVILISIIAANWIRSRILQPLDTLSKSAIMLTKLDDFKIIEFSEPKIHEIQELANSLNYMRELIDQTIKERERLLAGVTHDIRTPLSRIRIALELESFNSSIKNELLEDIYEMNCIIEQFNELARLEIETKETWQYLDINNLIKEIHNKYQRSNIIINLNLCEQSTNLMIKPLSLTRLLYNLIDNGYRFGAGNVTVSTYRSTKETVIIVSNPISEIIDQHYYNQNPFNKNTGLGLLLVKKFAELHNANLIEIKNPHYREYRVVFTPQTDQINATTN